jgi:hypothetical protein
MKKLCFAWVCLVLSCLSAAPVKPKMDPGHMDLFVTPYYESQGPVVTVGKYSAGLSSPDGPKFVTTITEMKRHWDELGFPEMYVAAIRLYDLGYRKESVYWFYSAQYRGRLFGMLLDAAKQGGIGDPGFELSHANEAFFSLIGPYINSYAFSDLADLTRTVKLVQQEGLEGRALVNLRQVYPRVSFQPESEWPKLNQELAGNMNKLLAMWKDHADEIRQQRIDQGVEAQFSKLPDKKFKYPKK